MKQFQVLIVYVLIVCFTLLLWSSNLLAVRAATYGTPTGPGPTLGNHVVDTTMMETAAWTNGANPGWHFYGYYLTNGSYTDSRYACIRNGASFQMCGSPMNQLVTLFPHPDWNKTSDPVYANPDPTSNWAAQTAPPDNATIKKVFVVARIWADYWTYVGLGFATNMFGSGSYQIQTTNTYEYIVGGGAYSIISWDVTSLHDWKAWELNGNGSPTWSCVSLAAMLNFNYDAGESLALYVDYLGFTYNYTVWTDALPSGGGSGGGGGSFLFGFTFSTEMIVSILGSIGFIGMIATPAVAILMYRMEDDDRIKIFVKAIIIFVFCFALFIWSIAS